MPIPAGYVAYRRTPVFTHDAVPSALLSAHETKDGAWAMIHVLEGKLRYCIEAPPSETILEPGQPGVIEPQVRHHVEPIGPVRFYLEFHRAPWDATRYDITMNCLVACRRRYYAGSH